MTSIQPSLHTPQPHSSHHVSPKFGGDGIDSGTGGSEDLSALIAKINVLEAFNPEDAGDYFKQLDKDKAHAQVQEAGKKPSKLRNLYNSVVVFLSGVRT